MNSFKKLPLSYQFTLLLLALAVIAAIGGYLIGASVYVSETRNQARTVADMVDNFGQWATRYRGVWVKDDPRDPKFDVGSFLERVHRRRAAEGQERRAASGGRPLEPDVVVADAAAARDRTRAERVRRDGRVDRERTRADDHVGRRAVVVAAEQGRRRLEDGRRDARARRKLRLGRVGLGGRLPKTGLRLLHRRLRQARGGDLGLSCRAQREAGRENRKVGELHLAWTLSMSGLDS